MNLFKSEGKERAALFTTFLNVKGKILFDAIICKPRLANQESGDVEYWVDVADYDAETILKHLKVSPFIT